MSYPVEKIELSNKKYPKILKQIPNSPKQLYCRGNLKLLNAFCIGVVGTRKFTSYGREATEKIVSGLAGNNIAIVSGLALGIDSVAHKTALDSGIPTIAVLGTGIDNESIYPNENLPLAKRILEEDGLIISEYAPGTKSFKGNFPARNRIISGLSKGTLVVEAPIKSGALITTAFAAEQNRDVFAVPGNIFSPNSQGPHMLIQKGAKPVFTAEDILGNYYQNLEFDLKPKSNISTPSSESSDILKRAAKPHSELLLLGTKNPVEKKILDILDEKGELSTDEIIRETNIETSTTLSTLSILEIKNLIKNLGNGKYRTAKG